MRFDGRNEKRVTMAIPVCLVTAKQLLFADQAMTVNVSPHGARVVTRRRWQPEEEPRLASSAGDLRGAGKGGLLRAPGRRTILHRIAILLGQNKLEYNVRFPLQRIHA